MRWSLGTAALGSLVAGAIMLQSCAGQGGSFGGGDGSDSNISEQFLALLPPGQAGAGYSGSNACEDCHNGQNGGDTYFDHWSNTLHKAQNVGCENCHGPGSIHVANPSKDNILALPKSTSSIVCAQCHGPIFDEYKFSQHSKLIVSPVQSAAQTPNGARTSRCITCHSGLFRTAVYERGLDPNDMTDQEIRTLAESTLNDLPHTATCATCHDPHMQTGKLSDNGKEVQLRHQVFNTDTSQVGPGTTAIQFTKFDHICAECHNGRGTDPSDAKLNSSTSRPSMHDSNQFNMLMGFGGVEGSDPPERNTAHANAPGQCSTCHMGNSRHSFTVSFDSACVPCHTPDDAATRTRTVKTQIQNELYALLLRMEAWSLATFGDKDLWNYTSLIAEEGKTPPNQGLVLIEVKRARHNYFFVIRDGCFGPHNAPYALYLLNIANQNLDQLGVPGPNGRQNVSEAQKAKVLEHQISIWKKAMRNSDE